MALTDADVTLIMNRVIGTDADGPVTVGKALLRTSWVYTQVKDKINQQLDRVEADVDDIQARI